MDAYEPQQGDPIRGLPLVDLPWRYAALPEGTTFLESACFHEAYDAARVFVPVSSDDPAVAGLWAVHLAHGGAERLCALAAGDLYYGSVLTADGTAFVCVGNQGTVLAVDLAGDRVVREIARFPDGVHPNDLALDAAGGRLLVATNEEVHDIRTLRGQMLNTLRIFGWGRGVVFAVDPAGVQAPEVLVDGLGVLAGAAVLDGVLWLSELTNLLVVPLDDPSAWRRHHPFDPRLLADNVRVHGDALWFPFYRSVSRAEARVLQSPWGSRVLYRLASQLPSSLFDALPAPASEDARAACFGRFDPATGEQRSWRMPVDPDFGSECTHLERVGEHLVFVNHLDHRLLIADAAQLPAGQVSRAGVGHDRS